MDASGDDDAGRSEPRGSFDGVRPRVHVGAPRAAATPESPVALVTSALVSSAAMAVVSPRASARFTTPAADLMSTRERRDPRAESVVVLSARKDLDSIQNRGPLPTFSPNRRVAVPTARAGAVEGA